MGCCGTQGGHDQDFPCQVVLLDETDLNLDIQVNKKRKHQIFLMKNVTDGEEF